MRHSCARGHSRAPSQYITGISNSRSAAISTNGCDVMCCWRGIIDKKCIRIRFEGFFWFFFVFILVRFWWADCAERQNRKTRPGIWSKSVKNMGSITSSGPKRISKTPIVSLQSHRRRDDLIKRLVMIHLLVSKRLTFSSYLNKTKTISFKFDGARNFQK